MTPRPEYEGATYKPAGKLEGKVALVTGGDSGIGRSVAYLYAREGADIAIVYLEEEHRDAVKVRDAIEKLGRRVLMIEGDVTDSAFCERAVDQTVETLGSLNILVNNAAYQQRKKTLDAITDAVRTPVSRSPTSPKKSPGRSSMSRRPSWNTPAKPSRRT